MSTVTYLPERGNRQWRIFEETMTAMLADTCSDDELAQAFAKVKPAFLFAFQPCISAGETVEGLLKSVNDWAYTIMTRLLMQLMRTEVELIRLRGVAPTKAGA